MTHPVRQDIRVRTILLDGDTVESRSVYCSSRGHSVPLAECQRCTYLRGVAIEEGHIICDGPHETSPAVWRRLMKKLFAQVAANTRVRDIMTRAVVCVTPDLSIDDVAELFLARNISGAPVVGKDGRPVGIVSKTDLVRERQEGLDGIEVEPAPLADLGPGFHETRRARQTAGDVMMPLAFTLHESASVAKASALMTEEGIHRLPIVDDDGKVVGILSSLDLVRWVAAAMTEED